MNITDIKYREATFRGRIIEDSKVFITEHGFCWDISDNPTKEKNHINLGETTQSGYYYNTVTDLSYNTDYYMRPYVQSKYSKESMKVFYGPNQHFRTLLPDNPSLGSLRFVGVANKNLTVQGKILDSNGRELINSYGFFWGLQSNITLETADSSIDLGLIPNEVGIITFQGKVTNLLPSKKYYIKIFAKIDDIKAEGDIYQFYTNKEECPCIKPPQKKKSPGLSKAMRCAQRIKSFGSAIIENQAKTLFF